MAPLYLEQATTEEARQAAKDKLAEQVISLDELTEALYGRHAKIEGIHEAGIPKLKHDTLKLLTAVRIASKLTGGANAIPEVVRLCLQAAGIKKEATSIT